MTASTGCALCEADGGTVLFRNALFRVLRVVDRDYPGFLRVVLNRHVSEMTDLDEDERARLMDAVWACERALRELFRPDKVNLASLGNQVPHLHWHVIARHRDDAHYPDAVWSAPKRPAAPCEPVVGDAEIGARLSELLNK